MNQEVPDDRVDSGRLNRAVDPKAFFIAVASQREQNRLVDEICDKKGVDEDSLYRLIHREAGSLLKERAFIDPSGSPGSYMETYSKTYLEVIEGFAEMSIDEIEAHMALDRLGLE